MRNEAFLVFLNMNKKGVQRKLTTQPEGIRNHIICTKTSIASLLVPHAPKSRPPTTIKAGNRTKEMPSGRYAKENLFML